MFILFAAAVRPAAEHTASDAQGRNQSAIPGCVVWRSPWCTKRASSK
jgi:hypothetical protein